MEHKLIKFKNCSIEERKRIFKRKQFKEVLSISILIILLLISRDFVFKNYASNFKKSFKVCPFTLEQSVNFVFHKLQYRKLGHKLTPNFLAKYINGNRANGIKNFHLNIRSLRNKVQEVKNIISKRSPHIFGLSEVELNSDTVNIESLKIPGYNIVFPKSWHTSGIARVLIYIKNTFEYEHVDDLEDSSFQSIWIKGGFKNSKRVYFCHAYREHISSHPVSYQRNQL